MTSPGQVVSYVIKISSVRSSAPASIIHKQSKLLHKTTERHDLLHYIHDLFRLLLTNNNVDATCLKVRSQLEAY